MERWRIDCEADFFFRIGFLSRKDDEVDRRLAGREIDGFKDFLASECSGP